MFALYVTGTDTGIGKTLASCALLHALRGHGLRAAGMKPVASGCERIDGAWRNADALALQAAGAPGIAYADINPFALAHPLAPELAARDAGVEVALPPILDAHARLAQAHDAVVVEGVGGWAAPLSATLMQADLVRALRLPVVLVVGLRLGCINHALLTAEAVRARGLPLAGWVANTVDAAMAHGADNLAALEAGLSAPLLGHVPRLSDPHPAAIAAHLPKALALLLAQQAA